MDTTFREATAQRRVESVPLSHLSVELGHLYAEDFAAGPARLSDQFARVRPWLAAVAETRLAGVARPRVSTCFLVDDYFTPFSTPADLVPQLVAAAAEHGLVIDYLVRESACAEADGSPLAELVAARLTASPPPGTNGSRPPVLESGWLANGQRSPGDAGREAMRREGWQPPVEIGARNHSVFVDVELWSEQDGRRTWSCAYLAAVWQLLRLGLLRDDGATVARPRPVSDGPQPEPADLPAEWAELPPVVQLNPAADPFCAYRTFSALPARFLPVEQAVRVVLDQVSPLAEVVAEIEQRAERERLPVPRSVLERIDYVFFSDW
jgi:hypothetical protein